MRSELLQRIHDLLGNEDLEAIRKDVRSAIQSFHALTQDEVRRQRDAWEKEEHEPDETFIYKPSEEEAVIEELSNSFKEREKAWKASIAVKCTKRAHNIITTTNVSSYPRRAFTGSDAMLLNARYSFIQSKDSDSAICRTAVGTAMSPITSQLIRSHPFGLIKGRDCCAWRIYTTAPSNKKF